VQTRLLPALLLLLPVQVRPSHSSQRTQARGVPGIVLPFPSPCPLPLRTEENPGRGWLGLLRT
jgi:hypothetical protein